MILIFIRLRFLGSAKSVFSECRRFIDGTLEIHVALLRQIVHAVMIVIDFHVHVISRVILLLLLWMQHQQFARMLLLSLVFLFEKASRGDLARGTMGGRRRKRVRGWRRRQRRRMTMQSQSLVVVVVVIIINIVVVVVLVIVEAADRRRRRGKVQSLSFDSQRGLAVEGLMTVLKGLF